MLAVTYDRYGPPEVLQLTTVDTPAASEGQVRLKVLAAGVTASDQYIRSAKASALTGMDPRSAHGTDPLN